MGGIMKKSESWSHKALQFRLFLILPPLKSPNTAEFAFRKCFYLGRVVHRLTLKVDGPYQKGRTGGGFLYTTKSTSCLQLKVSSVWWKECSVWSKYINELSDLLEKHLARSHSAISIYHIVNPCFQRVRTKCSSLMSSVFGTSVSSTAWDDVSLLDWC